MLRPQFTLKTILWLMALVAAFYAGAARERAQYLTSVGSWHHALKIQSDYNQRWQTENAQLRRQIAADHKRWLESHNGELATGEAADMAPQNGPRQ